MPIYEYYCLKCGEAFELLIRGSDRPACPACQTTKVERRLSLPARPQGKAKGANFSSLGPPKGAGGCGGGSCGCH